MLELQPVKYIISSAFENKRENSPDPIARKPSQAFRKSVKNQMINISDETMVGGHAWRDLKHKAM